MCFQQKIQTFILFMVQKSGGKTTWDVFSTRRKSWGDILPSSTGYVAGFQPSTVTLHDLWFA